MPLRPLLAGAILLATLIFVLAYPQPATLHIELLTEPIPTLLPHGHEISSRVSDRQHGVEVSSLPIEVTETMWVTEMSFETIRAPQSILHHLNVVRILPEDGSGFEKETVIARAGQDTVPFVRFPAPAGILLKPGDRLKIVGMLHNPVPPLGEGAVYKDVVVNVRLAGFRDGEGRSLPVYFNLAKVSDSEDKKDDQFTFQVPVGSEPFTRSSLENAKGVPGAFHRFVDDGWIISMGAHTHAWEGGTRVDAYINEERIRTFTSRLLDAKVPWSFRTDTPPIFVRVKNGDLLSTSATYLNEHDAPIEGAMGLIAVYYVLDGFTLLPPLYKLQWTVLGWYYDARHVVMNALSRD